MPVVVTLAVAMLVAAMQLAAVMQDMDPALMAEAKVVMNPVQSMEAVAMLLAAAAMQLVGMLDMDLALMAVVIYHKRYARQYRLRGRYAVRPPRGYKRFPCPFLTGIRQRTHNAMCHLEHVRPCHPLSACQRKPSHLCLTKTRVHR